MAPAPPRGRNDIWGWLVAALFAAAAIGLLFWGLSRPDTTRVPTVVGLPVANAAAQLRDRGFDPVVIRVPARARTALCSASFRGRVRS